MTTIKPGNAIGQTSTGAVKSVAESAATTRAEATPAARSTLPAAGGDTFEVHSAKPLGAMASARGGGYAAAMSDAKLEVADFLRGGKPLEQAMAHIGGFLASLGGQSQDAGLFETMLQYQKMVSKEAREDRQLAGPGSRLELALKTGELELENSKIDQQKDEAGERFDHAMAAAQTAMSTGAVSAASGAASALGQAIGELASFAEQLAAKLATDGGDDSGGKGAVETRHSALVSWLRDHDD